MAQTLEEIMRELDPETIQKIMGSPRLWAETCLVAPNTGLPFRAKEVQRQILDAEGRFNVIRVHRRAGKTYALVILALFYMITYERLKVVVVGPQATHVAQIFDTLREFIGANPWLSDLVVADSKSLPQTLRIANGSQILGFTTGARTSGKAQSLRGREAEILLIDEAHYLAEGDWSSITPIIQGDPHRIFPPRTFMASTPANTRGYYYEVCTSLEHRGVWRQVHMSLEMNPDVTEQYRQDCRATCPCELDYIREWQAEFPEIGEGVFPKTMVEKAWRDIHYPEALARAVESRKNPEARIPARTMGVDWDKYNKDGHGCNMVILEATAGGYRMIYREEIPQGEFTLTNAVRRVVELNEIFEPQWIYVDRGYGDPQLEQLQIEGKRNRGSGLDTKVIGCAFQEAVECPMPGGGVIKKNFKQVMISVLRGWFERGMIEIAQADGILYRQLTEYHVIGETERTIKFTGKNDHLIACMGLAAMAMWQQVKNPYTPRAATKSYAVPVPEAVPSELLSQRAFNPRTSALFGDDGGYTRQFTRKKLASSEPISRRRF